MRPPWTGPNVSHPKRPIGLFSCSKPSIQRLPRPPGATRWRGGEGTRRGAAAGVAAWGAEPSGNRTSPRSSRRCEAQRAAGGHGSRHGDDPLTATARCGGRRPRRERFRSPEQRRAVPTGALSREQGLPRPRVHPRRRPPAPGPRLGRSRRRRRKQAGRRSGPPGRCVESPSRCGLRGCADSASQKQTSKFALPECTVELSVKLARYRAENCTGPMPTLRPGPRTKRWSPKSVPRALKDAAGAALSRAS
ncbi:hypothetical protein CA12_07220 [Alienimonas californiensis]|uniref:Uncharacterized protein n=1 Tax=Alienimonas californiensis TaxID=2527989 RepID=A0A517P5L4_9PLAN|nr:hypothetical protein CA12_07220 [Alienimonas californiensis]